MPALGVESGAILIHRRTIVAPIAVWIRSTIVQCLRQMEAYYRRQLIPANTTLKARGVDRLTTESTNTYFLELHSVWIGHEAVSCRGCSLVIV